MSAAEPPSPGGLEGARDALRWAEQAVGGGHAVQVRRLPGATSSLVHGVTVVDGRGRTHRLVLRRYVGAWEADGPELVRREALVLDRLAATTGLRVAVPRLVATDPDAAAAGAPALLVTRLPGSPWVAAATSSHQPWAVGLAGALRAITFGDVPTDGLPPYTPWLDPPLRVPTWTAQPDAWARALSIVAAEEPAASTPTFVHRDLHPANVLWAHGEVRGVVDWLNGCVGPIENDVARTRVNLTVLASAQAADLFLAEVADLVHDYDPRWDLRIAAEFLPDPGALVTLTELGARVTPESARHALDLTVERALQALDAWG